MPRSISPTTSCWRCCSRRKPCGAAAPGGWCWWRPISATCGRMRPFTTARRSARRRRPAAWPATSTASSRSTPICTAPRTFTTSSRVSRPTIFRPCQRSRRRCVQAVSIRPRSLSGPTRNRGRGSPISRAGSACNMRSRKRRAAATARSRSTFADPELFAGRPVLLVDDIVSSGGTLITCAEGAHGRRRHYHRRRRHPRAVSAGTGARHFRAPASARVRSTDSVPHPTNAIMLDGVLVRCAALTRAVGARP